MKTDNKAEAHPDSCQCAYCIPIIDDPTLTATAAPEAPTTRRMFRPLRVPVDAERSYWKAEYTARKMSHKYLNCEVSIYRTSEDYFVSCYPLIDAHKGSSFVNGLRSYP